MAKAEHESLLTLPDFSCIRNITTTDFIPAFVHAQVWPKGRTLR